MTDFYDRLRELDANRVQWVLYAQAFERWLRHLPDRKARIHWRRVWTLAVQQPLADIDRARDLVETVRNEVLLLSPLTPEEIVALREEVPGFNPITEARKYDLDLSVANESDDDALFREAP